MNRQIVFILLLLAPSASLAQGHPQKEESESARVTVYFKGKNNSLELKILQKNVTLSTKYGPLTIPFTDICKIELGFRCPENIQQDIKNSISLLDSRTYRQREDAARFLEKKGYLAYPFLKQTIRTPKMDLELIKRASMIIKLIEEKCSPKLLVFKEYDTVQTKESTIIGRLVETEFKVKCEDFEDAILPLKIHRLSAIFGESQAQKVDLDSAVYTTSPENWFNTRLEVRKGSQVTVTADGMVDIWPQAPGQYMATPKGHSTVGKPSEFLAGALVGRIGEKGKTFMLGERYENMAEEEGTLFLAIVASSWNNQSLGRYQVRAMVGLAPPR